MSELLLQYGKPAENSVKGWENESLPIGNGFTGVSIFGGVKKERLQITDPTLYTRGKDTYYRSMCSFADLYLNFPHKRVQNYERGLDLNTAKAYVKYSCEGVDYKREYFISNPSKLLVMKFTASQKGALNFEIAPEISYLQDYHQYEGDGGGKSGDIYAENLKLVLKGKAHWFNIDFEAQIRVLHNSGNTIFGEKSIFIENADEVVLLFGESTNYKLLPELFTEEDDHKKLPESNPHEDLEEVFEKAPKITMNLKKSI